MQTPLSPKVLAGIIGGILASAILANLQYITPDLFKFLGGWGVFGYGVVITAATGAAGFLKRDLYRDLGSQALRDAGSAAQTLPTYPSFPDSPTLPALSAPLPAQSEVLGVPALPDPAAPAPTDPSAGPRHSA